MGRRPCYRTLVVLSLAFLGAAVPAEVAAEPPLAAGHPLQATVLARPSLVQRFSTRLQSGLRSFRAKLGDWNQRSTGRARETNARAQADEPNASDSADRLFDEAQQKSRGSEHALSDLRQRFSPTAISSGLHRGFAQLHDKMEGLRQRFVTTSGVLKARINETVQGLREQARARTFELRQRFSPSALRRDFSSTMDRSVAAARARLSDLRHSISPMAVRQRLEGAYDRFRANREQGRLLRGQARAAHSSAAQGDVDGAVAQLRALEAQGPRSGLSGFFDRHRLAKAQRYVTNQFDQQGRALIQQGAAPEAVASYWQGLREVSKLGTPSRGLSGRLAAWRTDGRVRGFEKELTQVAGQLSRAGYHGAAHDYLALAGTMKQEHGHALGLKYQWTRLNANRRAWSFFKQANREEPSLEMARATIKLVEAYAQERGKSFSAGQSRAVHQAYARALVSEMLAKKPAVMTGAEASRVAGRMIRQAAKDELLSPRLAASILASVKQRTGRGETVTLGGKSGKLVSDLAVNGQRDRQLEKQLRSGWLTLRPTAGHNPRTLWRLAGNELAGATTARARTVEP